MKGGTLHTFRKVIQNEGVLALYKGLIPPLIGSSIFRSVQFGVFNACMTSWKDTPSMRYQIPLTGGLENRVVIGGVLASTARAIVETPLELIKVRLQVGQPWNTGSLMQGFTVTWIRTTGLMTTFFILCDTFDRHLPQMTSIPMIGPFLKGGIAATVGWWVVWPFENLKSQIQAGNLGPHRIWPRFFWTIQQGGVAALFRGFVPGSLRSIIANGCSMLAYQWCQELRLKYIGH